MMSNNSRSWGLEVRKRKKMNRKKWVFLSILRIYNRSMPKMEEVSLV
jgi:hypothetical protein